MTEWKVLDDFEVGILEGFSRTLGVGGFVNEVMSGFTMDMNFCVDEFGCVEEEKDAVKKMIGVGWM